MLQGSAESEAWSALFRSPERVGWELLGHGEGQRRPSDRAPVWSAAAGQRRPRSPAERWLGRAGLTRWLAAGYGAVADLVWPLLVRHVYGGPRPNVRDATRGLTEQQARAEEAAALRKLFAVPIALVAFVLFFLWRLAAQWREAHLSSVFFTILLAAVFGTAAGLVWAALVGAHLRAVRRYWRQSYQVYRETRLEPWLAAGQRYEIEEYRRLSEAAGWASARVASGARRVDVVGGNLYGWEALLTVAGASILADGGALTVLDLTGDIVAAELVRGAQGMGHEVGFALLPTEVAQIDLLAGLDVAEVVNLFAEARHGGPGRPDRGTRAVDERILAEVCGVLAPGGLTMGRIAAGLRVLMDAPSTDSVISDDERMALAGGIFSDEYRRQTFANVRDLEAMAHPLSAMGTAATGTGPAGLLAGQLRVVSMSSQWSRAPDDFLCDLLVGWIARQVAGNPGSVPTLVVAGAGGLAVRHIHRLSDLCQRRGVRLVMMFRHLDETADAVVGDGPVAFMRLGNHQQATRAAEFIGREYSFKLSQLSKTVGGGETHSVADNESTTDSRGHARGRTAGGGISEKRGGSGRQDVLGWRPDEPASWGTSRTTTWNRSDSKSWNRSRTWGRTVTDATASTWSSAQGRQRVHEHRVDPEVIKNLPDYALLLVEPTGDGRPRVVRAVEVNPEIAVLEAYSANPRAQHPAASVPAPRPPVEPGAEHDRDGSLAAPRHRRGLPQAQAPDSGWAGSGRNGGRRAPAKARAQRRKR